jgi:hypothetical protein
MSKRLQVLLDEAELREIKKAARRDQVTVAEWVRRALRQARKEGPMRDTMRKLDTVRLATEHSFPTADIDEMLAQIERGYESVDAP